MKVARHHFEQFLRDPWAARGKADYEAGTWTEVTGEDAATTYEIGRLIAAEQAQGLVTIRKGRLPGVADSVDIDAFTVDRSGGFHAHRHGPQSHSPKAVEPAY